VAEPIIRFEDGAAYEQMMGAWSRLVGSVFLEWLAPPLGLRWIDVGCGNGAFTEVLIEQCAPTWVEGIDPSEGQLSYARNRLSSDHANFRRGDAMALPFANHSFDAAVMALVLVFVSEPRKAVEEMVRVVKPGGSVATYMWDMLGDGFPLEPILVEMHNMGLTPLRPPRMEASAVGAMRELWEGAGLDKVEMREIKVRRAFASFEDFWLAKQTAPSIGPTIAAMSSSEVETLKERVRARLPSDAEGRITYGARANAISGRVRTG
jgi:ubiquinone/menaquinone biosynthesis C-methylase UbiE